MQAFMFSVERREREYTDGVSYFLIFVKLGLYVYSESRFIQFRFSPIWTSDEPAGFRKARLHSIYMRT